MKLDLYIHFRYGFVIVSLYTVSSISLGFLQDPFVPLIIKLSYIIFLHLV